MPEHSRAWPPRRRGQLGSRGPEWGGDARDPGREEVSVWAWPRVAVGATGLPAGSGRSGGFASLGPATRGRSWRGARSREADALRAQWQPAPGSVRVSHRRFPHRSLAAPSPEEFFIRVITLSSLKADKYHPGTKGARPPLNCSRVHRPRGCSYESGARVPRPRSPMPPARPRRPQSGRFLLHHKVLKFSYHLLRKAFSLMPPFQVTPQTLLLDCLNLTFLHLFV